MGFRRVVWTIARRLAILSILILAFISSALLAIYFSRGNEVSVPKVVGKSQSEAKNIAKAAGLQVDAIEIFDEQAPADIVVRQDPKAGMQVKQGYTIKIYFSRGAKKSQARQPETTISTQAFMAFIRETCDENRNCTVNIGC